MLPDRVSNPGPLTYESGALPIALRGPAKPSNKGEYGSKLFFNSFIGQLKNHLPVKIWMHMKHCCTPKTQDNCVFHGF